MKFIFILSMLLLMPPLIRTMAQDTIKVHFLYGSKPARAFKNSEKKWFGGKWGGHVGIEFESGKIIDFIPAGKFHIFPQKKFHSRFVIRSYESFIGIFGSLPEEVKSAVVAIPVSNYQKRILDSIIASYSSNTPYDYAFLGMRCAAAGYDILNRAGILKPTNSKTVWIRVFYPRKLRKQIFELAAEKKWPVKIQYGSIRRKWDKK